MKKKLILVFFVFLSTSLMAENAILKCIDSKGRITYLNDTVDEKCKQTNIAEDSKKSILNKKIVITNSDKDIPEGSISIKRKPLLKIPELETKIDIKEIEKLVKQIQSGNDIEKGMKANGL